MNLRSIQAGTGAVIRLTGIIVGTSLVGMGVTNPSKSYAQVADSTALSFEVASIRPSNPEHRGAQTFFPGPDRFTAMTATLKDLVMFAYDVRTFQVVGGPQWCDSEPYDVTAKADGAPGPEKLRLMIQALLADRFGLKLRPETRVQPIYELVIGNKGTNLKEVAGPGRGIRLGKGELHAYGVPMATLANVLSTYLGRRVVDRTKLTGSYDFTLTWAPDDEIGNDNQASVFAAIQEQLGLRLAPAKGPVNVLVIEKAEHPSEN